MRPVRGDPFPEYPIRRRHISRPIPSCGSPARYAIHRVLGRFPRAFACPFFFSLLATKLSWAILGSGFLAKYIYVPAFWALEEGRIASSFEIGLARQRSLSRVPAQNGVASFLPADNFHGRTILQGNRTTRLLHPHRL